MLGSVLIVDLDNFFSWGLLVETKFSRTNAFSLTRVLTILNLFYFFLLTTLSFPITIKLSIDRSVIHVVQFLQCELR